MEQKTVSPNIVNHYLFYDKTFKPSQQFMLVPVGSWNYNCADERSDVDTKAIFVPTLRDIVENRCEAYTHLLPNEEHIDCCDIRNYMKSLIKGNPQFLETLFSNWGDLNTGYYGEEIHAKMSKAPYICECYRESVEIYYKNDYRKSQRVVGRCMGTKEREECTCGGDENMCDFYPEKRGEK